MVVIARVQPLSEVIMQSKRRRDDYEWEGDFEKAHLENEHLKMLKDSEERGEVWHPNF
jgi:hypothetical protein|tara:strand:- start:379 stop:552 length:174 start_codon:yes stop_codon:yes gene_type:complete